MQYIHTGSALPRALRSSCTCSIQRYTAHEHFNTRHCLQLVLHMSLRVHACLSAARYPRLSPLASLYVRLAPRRLTPQPSLSLRIPASPSPRHSLCACLCVCISYPGGCGVPSAQASATSSPLSPPGIVSNSVAWYVTPTTATTQRVWSSPIWV